SLVCVNDGSRDDTLAQLLAEHERDPRIKVIDLSRNFGKEYALSAYEKGERQAGKSKWGMWRLTTHALDGISAFSDLPLRISSVLGALIAGLSMIYGVVRVLRAAFHGIDVPGYESIIVAILFLGGVQLLSLGILGSYIGRIFKEVKGRPLYVVRRTYGLESPPGPLTRAACDL
ncbi:MAG TPA: glycosyltransferase, partial [Dongiaceae bacterium]